MNTFTFIDLFAGIGGMRLGFEAHGGSCIFSSEWDPHCQLTYLANFGEVPAGDITKIPSEQIPSHDVLLAGFPCQAFSIAGISKKRSLRRPEGFEDKIQGTLFFEVARILRDKKPKAFLLENVKHLKHHDNGNTFRIIMKTLDELGYDAFPKIIDAAKVVPQHRERIFIAGFRKSLGTKGFEFSELRDKKPKVIDILEKNVDPKYTLSNHLWKYLRLYAEKHRAKGNGFGFGLVDLDGRTRTLSARYFKDGSEILIPHPSKNPRRLTPRECARLMGFPKSFKIVVSDTQAYKQFGNSVVVPVVKTISERLVGCL